MVYAISLPFIGNTVGWIMTEMGRQPWVVFGVMKTEDAVSPNVTFGEVLFSLISFTSMYLIMGGICVYLFVRTIKSTRIRKRKRIIKAMIHLIRRKSMLSLNELWF